MTETTHQPYAHIKGVKYGPPYLYPIEPTTPDPERKARDEAIRAKRRKRIEERKAGKCP